jgi:hypothetical protein
MVASVAIAQVALRRHQLIARSCSVSGAVGNIDPSRSAQSVEARASGLGAPSFLPPDTAPLLFAYNVPT